MAGMSDAEVGLGPASAGGLSDADVGLGPGQPPGRKAGLPESIATGAEHGLTFGFAPALHGLSEASGVPETAPGMGPYDLSVMGIPVRPLMGAGRMLADWAMGHPDPKVMESYERGRKAVLERERLANEQHPYAYLGGMLAGSLGTPGLGLARGASALGRMGYGSAAGAAGAGLYGLGESVSQEKSLGEAAKTIGTDIGLGTVLGGAGSAALEAARPVASRVVNAIRGIHDPEAEASRRVVSTLANDWTQHGPSLTQEEIAAAHAAGTPMALVDTGGERTRALLRSAANTSPEARQAATEMTAERFREQAPRVSRFIQDMTGGGNLAADTTALQEAARRANRPAYRAAYDAGDRPIWSDELERLTASPIVSGALRGAENKWKAWQVVDGFGATNPPVRVTPDGLFEKTGGRGIPTYPNLQFWDYAARDIADKAAAARRAGQTQRAALYGNTERQLKTELDRLVPEYQGARRGAAGFFGAGDALEAGAQFVAARSNMDMGEAAAALGRMTGPERQLFARGYATELAQRIANSGDSRNVLNSVFLNNAPARARTEMALGPQNARQLEALLRAESVIDRARTALGNSTTSRQLAEMGMAGGAEMLLEQDFNPAHVFTAAMLPVLARRGAQVIDQRVARRVGEMLASNDPAVLARGMQIVTRNPRVFEALREVTGAGARVGAEAIEERIQGREQGGHVGVLRQHGGRVNAANINQEPTDGQKRAGNYAKDHVSIHGLDITIENAKGHERRGVDKDGKPWSVSMPCHYGYFKRTEGKDGDHVDVYLGHHLKSPKVFVIDQKNAETGRFDEHKTFLGFASEQQVRACYAKAFSDGKAHKRLGHIEEMTVAQFKHWLANGDTTKPIKDGEDKKLPHSSVAYVARSPHRDKRCSLCSMFVTEGPHCTLVQDPIEAGAYCRRFVRKKD
jgi:hypothetical protein